MKAFQVMTSFIDFHAIMHLISFSLLYDRFEFAKKYEFSHFAAKTLYTVSQKYTHFVIVVHDSNENFINDKNPLILK